MKPVNFMLLTYIDFGTANNDVITKFKVDDHVGTSQNKNIFAKTYKPNWSEVFVIEKVKYTVPWLYVIEDLNGEEIVGTIYVKESQKTNQSLELKKYQKKW